MRFFFISILAVVVSLHSRAVYGQAGTVQEAVWKTPDGSVVDFAQTFTNGQTLALSWNAWNSTSYINTQPSDVTLWATSYDWSTNYYNATVKTHINLSQSGTLAWTINIPSSNLATGAKYVLRFIAPGQSPDDTNQISSPGFIVLAAATVSSSTPSTTSSKVEPPSTATATSTVTALAPTSSSTSTASTSSSSTSTTSSLSSTILPSTAVPSTSSAPLPVALDNDTSLSVGAKAGIGIGAVVGGLLVIVALIGLIYLLRKSKSQPTTAAQSQPPFEADYKEKWVDSTATYPSYKDPYHNADPNELPSRPPNYMPPAAELS